MAPRDFPGINPNQFTIGIEIEMIIPYLVGQQHFHGDRFEFVSQALKTLADDMKTGIAINEPVARREVFKFFQVKTDDSIESEDSSDGRIEIATPILRNKAWNWVVPRVCDSMRCAAQFAGTQLSFNSTTGLHVHIAIADRSFTLAELRRISKALFIFERHMSHFHPKSRRCTDLGPFRMQLCRNSLPLVGLSDEEALSLIDKGSNLDEIVYNVNGVVAALAIDGEKPRENIPSRYFKYNFTPLSTYGTIEFREAIGTDDEFHILDWIRTVIKFVTAAIKTSDHLFVEWARNGIPPVVYSVYGVPKPPGYRRLNENNPLGPPALQELARRYKRK
ncbi:uncharacterized protein H6S33_006170 [Morchella sextelata]|uniref:uncharacterized protein n=1 Tax=Morchella sextelata TaxID=1174677 RepID=UPI001D04F26F|nr:uncharacterized protein H6S33_006170 [Morchella sextelata]KAH0614284.1 hypothetical protein H6S33_006170 [Morchella sextelata]